MCNAKVNANANPTGPRGFMDDVSAALLFPIYVQGV